MAIRFDSVADRLAYSTVAPPATFTITCWAYLSVDRATWSTFLQLRDSGDGFVVDLAANGTSGPLYFDGSGTLSGTTNFTVGEWRKIAVTRTGSAGQVLSATEAGATEVVSGTVTTGTPTSITLGARGPGDTAQWWNGRLAHVRVWSAVLTQAEIETEWAKSAPARTSGLWANWPLSTATDLTDATNGRVLTVAAGGVPTTEEDPPTATGGVLVRDLTRRDPRSRVQRHFYLPFPHRRLGR